MTELSASQGILRTVKAFESQIEEVSNAPVGDENRLPFGDLYVPLRALLQLRGSLRKVVSETSFKRVVLTLVEDDASGWPRLKLTARMGDSLINELTIGASDRRNGPVIIFKEALSESPIEIEESEYIDPVLCDRKLRGLIRSFFEAIKVKISETNSIQQKVASVLQMLPEESVSGFAKDKKLDIASSEEFKVGDVFEEETIVKSSPAKTTASEESLEIEDIDFFGE